MSAGPSREPWTVAALRAATRPAARPAAGRRGPGRPHPGIATPRLVLRPAADGDVAVLARQWSDPAVGRYLWDGRPVPHGVAAAVVRDSHRSFGQHGYGLWAVCRQGLVVGCCGLRASPQVAGVELLFALERAAWGRGYAAEAARAVLDHARRHLGLARVIAVVDPENAASWRLLEAIGMRRTGRAGGPADLLLYST